MHHFVMIFETINLPELGVWGLFKYHFGFVLTHTLDHHLNSFFLKSPMKPADGFLVCSCKDYCIFNIIDFGMNVHWTIHLETLHEIIGSSTKSFSDVYPIFWWSYHKFWDFTFSIYTKSQYFCMILYESHQSHHMWGETLLKEVKNLWFFKTRFQFPFALWIIVVS